MNKTIVESPSGSWWMGHCFLPLSSCCPSKAELLRTVCLLLNGRKVSQANLWLHYIYILKMCACLVPKDWGIFCYPPLVYNSFYVKELLKMETSIVPRIMLYTLWSPLGVCLLIKPLRNLYLLWIFRKFLLDTCASLLSWREPARGLRLWPHSCLTIILIGLSKAYNDSD